MNPNTKRSNKEPVITCISWIVSRHQKALQEQIWYSILTIALKVVIIYHWHDREKLFHDSTFHN